MYLYNNIKEFLNEHLKNIKSTDSWELYNLLKDKFKNAEIDRPTDMFLETIEIIIKNADIKDDLIHIIKTHNWYLAKDHLNNIVIKPIVSKGIIENVPSILYHATPSNKIETIMNHGIKPKSENIRHIYPPRIYLCDSITVLHHLIKELKQWKNNKEYSIVKIDTDGLNLTLYKDIDVSYSGCYYIQGIDNIPTEKIEIEETNL